MIENALFSLADRVALITGASSGLGSRFAQVAAANGAKVVLVGRRKERLEEVHLLISSAGGTSMVAVADVRDANSMRQAFDMAEREYGVVDTFVGNAAVPASTNAMDVTADVWRRTLGTNLDAIFFGAQEAARRLMLAGLSGSIINIASISGMIAGSEAAAYSIAKSGVLQITKVLAKELGPHGIRVNAIAPGWVLTEMSRGALSGDAGSVIAATTPLRRFAETSDFDGPFLLLASKAGSFMTGAVLVVDGGRLLTLS